MEFSIEQITAVLITAASIAAALLTNRKYQAAKERLLEFVGDLADFLAIVYAACESNTLCEPETMKRIAGKVEELWMDMKALGPTFAALLAQKSSLAESLAKK